MGCVNSKSTATSASAQTLTVEVETQTSIRITQELDNGSIKSKQSSKSRISPLSQSPESHISCISHIHSKSSSDDRNDKNDTDNIDNMNDRNQKNNRNTKRNIFHGLAPENQIRINEKNNENKDENINSSEQCLVKFTNKNSSNSSNTYKSHKSHRESISEDVLPCINDASEDNSVSSSFDIVYDQFSSYGDEEIKAAEQLKPITHRSDRKGLLPMLTLIEEIDKIDSSKSSNSTNNSSNNSNNNSPKYNRNDRNYDIDINNNMNDVNDKNNNESKISFDVSTLKTLKFVPSCISPVSPEVYDGIAAKISPKLSNLKEFKNSLKYVHDPKSCNCMCDACMKCKSKLNHGEIINSVSSYENNSENNSEKHNSSHSSHSSHTSSYPSYPSYPSSQSGELAVDPINIIKPTATSDEIMVEQCIRAAVNYRNSHGGRCDLSKQLRMKRIELICVGLFIIINKIDPKYEIISYDKVLFKDDGKTIRPDLVLKSLISDMIVHVEIDEHGHSGYHHDDEIKRENAIADFYKRGSTCKEFMRIRFNPDVYTNPVEAALKFTQLLYINDGLINAQVVKYERNVKNIKNEKNKKNNKNEKAENDSNSTNSTNNMIKNSSTSSAISSVISERISSDTVNSTNTYSSSSNSSGSSSGLSSSSNHDNFSRKFSTNFPVSSNVKLKTEVTIVGDH